MYESISFGGKGSNVTLYPYITFINPENIFLNNNIIISEYCFLHGGIKTVIGNFIHIASFGSISGGGVCILEDFVGLSAGVRIITGSEMIHGEGLTNPTIPAEFRAVYRSFVHIQKHALLSTNVIVHPGVTIGEGAVIGSNSVVNRDVEPWTINVGMPINRIAKRPNDKIKKLEKELYLKYNIVPPDDLELNHLKKIQEFIPE